MSPDEGSARADRLLKPSLHSLLPQAWKSVLSPAALEALAGLDAFLKQEAAVLPAPTEIFAALEATPPEQVRGVILGQDPYPTPGHANGLAFSVSRGVKLPGSLRNLYAGLEADLGIARPTHGDLSAWAGRGLLLLNTVLTVRPGEAHAHKKKGWETVTGEFLQGVDRQPHPVVFFCFGKPAQALVDSLVKSPHHLVLKTPHPSPLTGGAFLQAVRRDRPFSRANAFLAAHGRGALDWSCDPP